jgi:hypothetical protein
MQSPIECADDDDDSGWDSCEDHGNYEGDYNELYVYGTRDCRDYAIEDHVPPWKGVHVCTRPSGIVVVQRNSFALHYAVVDKRRTLREFYCPRPYQMFSSPFLCWENVEPFADHETMIDAVLQGTRPIATATFLAETTYQTFLDKVKVSGFPFQTKPEQLVISVAQPLTLGQAFDMKAWVDCFTVQLYNDEDEPPTPARLLSEPDKAYLLSFQDYPLSTWLGEGTVLPPTSSSALPSNKDVCDKALTHLLSGHPMICALSCLWRVYMAHWNNAYFR